MWIFGLSFLFGALLGWWCVELLWQSVPHGLHSYGFMRQRDANYVLMSLFCSMSTGTLSAALTGWQQLQGRELPGEQ